MPAAGTEQVVQALPLLLWIVGGLITLIALALGGIWAYLQIVTFLEKRAKKRRDQEFAQAFSEQWPKARQQVVVEIQESLKAINDGLGKLADLPAQLTRLSDRLVEVEEKVDRLMNDVGDLRLEVDTIKDSTADDTIQERANRILGAMDNFLRGQGFNVPPEPPPTSRRRGKSVPISPITIDDLPAPGRR